MTISVNAAPNVSDATVSVAAGANATGDVHDDVADSDDADSVLVVTGVASGNESSNNTIVTDGTGVGSSVSGTYGSLNIAANGTYTYTANATNNIAAGGTANDIFTFTTRDDETNAGSFAFDVGTITFTVASSISLVNDTDAVVEDGTVTHLTNSAGTVILDDTADSNGLVVTNISHTNGNTDTIESGSTYTDSGGEPGIVVGTYGTLTIGADGTYTYTADQSAADALDAGDTATDSFTYTVSDGTATDTATLIITVTGVNDAPSAVNDTGHIKEGGTLTVANSGSAVSGTSTGSNTGDITDNDTDADASSTATITAIQHSGAGSATSVSDVTYTSGSATSVSGTYGTLTIGSDGSYKYVANSNISSFDAGDSNVTDVFTYTVSDGTATDTATLTITVIPSQDISAVNDTDSVNEDGTTTQRNGSGLLTADDTEPDSDTLTVTHIKPTSGSNSTVSSGTTFLNGTSITGTYGTLVVGADGSYTYTADQSAADALDASETATDSFTYTVTDGQGETDTATLVITVTGCLLYTSPSPRD